MTRPPDKHEAPAAPQNRASNGYWIHDAFGPRHYVAPDAGQGSDTPPPDLIATVFAALRRVPGLDISRLHLAVEGKGVALAGTVATDEDRRRALAAAAAAAPGMPVEDRMTVVG